MPHTQKQVNVSDIPTDEIDTKMIHSLHEVTQDMWADGIWEFVQCEDCGKMHSKKDIFWSLPKHEYEKTVQELLGSHGPTNLSCQDCSGRTRFVYGDENLWVIEERLLRTKRSFLVVERNHAGKIVGYEDAYVSDLEDIFRREFLTHYGEIGFPVIRERVESLLWKIKMDEFLVLSDIGFLTSYRNFTNLFKVLSRIAQIMPPDTYKYPWFTELDEENSLYKISEALGGKSLWIRKDPVLGPKITNVSGSYKSDLIVYERVAEIYANNFGYGNSRSLLRLMKSVSQKSQEVQRSGHNRNSSETVASNSFSV